jgi:SAM-dependent methyltransferase
MRKELKELRDDAKARLLKTISISYEVADARKLPYKGESFDLLLEKGTLDAMLSGGDGSGSENCRQIVSECGRVLKKGGLLLLVSHINAHTDTGLQWLDEVIVPGLRNGAGKFAWVVEVHGNEPDTLSDGEQANPDDDDTQQDSPGPCVYIIKKGRAELKDDEYDPKNPPTIPLRFFNY